MQRYGLRSLSVLLFCLSSGCYNLLARFTQHWMFSKIVTINSLKIPNILACSGRILGIVFTCSLAVYTVVIYTVTHTYISYTTTPTFQGLFDNSKHKTHLVWNKTGYTGIRILPGDLATNCLEFVLASVLGSFENIIDREFISVPTTVHVLYVGLVLTLIRLDRWCVT